MRSVNESVNESVNDENGNESVSENHGNVNHENGNLNEGLNGGNDNRNHFLLARQILSSFLRCQGHHFGRLRLGTVIWDSQLLLECEDDLYRAFDAR